MMLSFRLLDLPQVALSNCINLLGPSELFTISFCSKIAYSLIKSHRKKSIKWDIWICAGPFQRTCVDLNKTDVPTNLLGVRHVSKAPEDFDLLKINGYTVPVIIENNYLITFWEDTVLGLSTVSAYTLDLLDKHEITAIAFGKSTIRMLEWLNQRAVTVGDGLMDGLEHLTAEEYSMILRNCQATEGLYVYGIPPEGFEYNGRFHTCTCFDFQSGFWVSIDNLMAMDAKNIFIEKSKLKSFEINRYLKNWLDGGSYRLKHLSIEIENLVVDEILDGFEDNVELVEMRRQYTWAPDAVRKLNSSYKMRRNDGVIALFIWRRQQEDGRFEFCLLVWPDFDGNDYE